jgi:hypothetical protein
MPILYSMHALRELDGRQCSALATIHDMGRYTFPAFDTATTPRYVVVWDLAWQVIDCQRVEPAADLSGAMAATIERLSRDGWEAEATPEYGFVFVRRESERCLMLTPRDPYATAPQSFSRFGSAQFPPSPQHGYATQQEGQTTRRR